MPSVQYKNKRNYPYMVNQNLEVLIVAVPCAEQLAANIIRGQHHIQQSHWLNTHDRTPSARHNHLYTQQFALALSQKRATIAK